VTVQTLIKWENDITEPKASQVSKLSKILNISESEICKGKRSNETDYEKVRILIMEAEDKIKKASKELRRNEQGDMFG
jgi:transcriptional regulator with XRE-family HTH domain